ncbi:hypothetical protein cypCar_00045421, partial [Cyprinus carpio]
ADSGNNDSRAADVVKKPWEKPSSVSRLNSASKSQDKIPVSPATTAPLSRTRPSSSTGDAGDLEKLKQDILEEMRSELQKVKDEIISALLEKLQKINAA